MNDNEIVLRRLQDLVSLKVGKYKVDYGEEFKAHDLKGVELGISVGHVTHGSYGHILDPKYELLNTQEKDRVDITLLQRDAAYNLKQIKYKERQKTKKDILIKIMDEYSITKADLCEFFDLETYDQEEYY